MNFLITYAYLREITDISQNVDDKILFPKVKLAHDQLKFILGNNFYNDILNNFNPLLPNDGFTNDYYNIYNPYIKEFLAWQSYEYYLIKANLIDTRTGIRVFKEANSEAATDKQIGELLSLAKTNVQNYKGALINFIMQAQTINTNAYPLFTVNFPQSFMGSTFNITAINGRDKRYSKINVRTTTNGPMPDSPSEIASNQSTTYNITGTPL